MLFLNYGSFYIKNTCKTGVLLPKKHTDLSLKNSLKTAYKLLPTQKNAKNCFQDVFEPKNRRLKRFSRLKTALKTVLDVKNGFRTAFDTRKRLPGRFRYQKQLPDGF